MNFLKAFLKIPWSGKITLMIGILGNLTNISLILPFLTLPRGAETRPMMWSALVSLVSLVTFIIGLPAALISSKTCRPSVSLTGAILSLTPYPLTLILIRIIQAVVGFEISS